MQHHVVLLFSVCVHARVIMEMKKIAKFNVILFPGSGTLTIMMYNQSTVVISLITVPLVSVIKQKRKLSYVSIYKDLF